MNTYSLFWLLLNISALIGLTLFATAGVFDQLARIPQDRPPHRFSRVAIGLFVAALAVALWTIVRLTLAAS